MKRITQAELDGILERISDIHLTLDPRKMVTLSRLDLSYHDFSCMDLRGVDFSHSNLAGADFNHSCLGGANFSDSNLRGANFSNATLDSVNFLNADIRLAKFYEARIDHTTAGLLMVCPEEGEFVGWKKARLEWGRECIVKLLIPADAERSSATTRKCRASKAKVLEIQNLAGEELLGVIAHSKYRDSFTHKKGEIIIPDDFDEDRWNECSNGIHFFITRREAVEY